MSSICLEADVNTDQPFLEEYSPILPAVPLTTDHVSMPRRFLRGNAYRSQTLYPLVLSAPSISLSSDNRPANHTFRNAPLNITLFFFLTEAMAEAWLSRLFILQNSSS